jgi:hypothetical protein
MGVIAEPVDVRGPGGQHSDGVGMDQWARATRKRPSSMAILRRLVDLDRPSMDVGDGEGGLPCRRRGRFASAATKPREGSARVRPSLLAWILSFRNHTDTT